MTFKKYMHIERFGNDEVDGIELGKCYIFPKVDGTNSSTWLCNGTDYYLMAGSRNRPLTLENDNAGFFAFVNKNDPLNAFHTKYRTLRLYGEWLVPHTLKTYREDAWRRFYIFDVMNDETNQLLSYDVYQPLLEEFGLDYIVPLKIITNGDYEHFIHELQNNNFLIQDGAGVGEGIVIKNYDYYNKFGNQVWAKIVSSEFKEQNHKVFGIPEKEGKLIEQEIVDEFITKSEVDKTKAKITTAEDGWSSRQIPRLLETVFYDLVTENTWQILRKFKYPRINFKTLKALSINRIKQLSPELF